MTSVSTATVAACSAALTAGYVAIAIVNPSLATGLAWLYVLTLLVLMVGKR